MKKILIIIILLMLTGCDNHHANEQLIKDIFDNLDSIEVAFEKNGIDIVSYKNSKSKGSSFQKFWGEYFKEYNGYKVIGESSAIGENYYTSYESINGEIIDVLDIRQVDGAYGCKIMLLGKNNTWILRGFELYSVGPQFGTENNSLDSLFME